MKFQTVVKNWSEKQLVLQGDWSVLIGPQTDWFLRAMIMYTFAASQ